MKTKALTLFDQLLLATLVETGKLLRPRSQRTLCELCVHLCDLCQKDLSHSIHRAQSSHFRSVGQAD